MIILSNREKERCITLASLSRTSYIHWLRSTCGVSYFYHASHSNRGKGDMVFRIPYLAQNRVRAHLAGAGHHEEDVEGKEARHEEEERHRVQEVALRALKRVKGRSNSGPSEKTLKKISMERFPSMLKPVHETQCTFLFNLLHRLSTRSSAAERLLHIKFHPSLHDDSF